MRKIYLLVVFTLVVFLGYAQQNFSIQRSSYRNNITITPLIFLNVNFVDVKYEHAINDIFSFAFNPVYWNTERDDGIRLFNFWVQGRIYLSDEEDAPRGLFVAPEVSLGLMSARVNSRRELAQTANTGLVLGYQFVVKRRFNVDLYLGATRYYVLNNPEIKDLIGNNKFILPSWGLGAGYAF